MIPRWMSPMMSAVATAWDTCIWSEAESVRGIAQESDRQWSSCAAHCGNTHELLSHHPAYIALGTSAAQRAQACRFSLEEVLTDGMIQEIRAYLQQQRALGCDDFRAMVEAKTRRFAGIRPAHRPPKSPPYPSQNHDSKNHYEFKPV